MHDLKANNLVVTLSLNLLELVSLHTVNNINDLFAGS